MITDSFDNKTEEIIKVWKNEDAKKVDACILTFSNEIFQYVLEAIWYPVRYLANKILISD